MALVVKNGRIDRIAPSNAVPEAIRVERRAIVPGFVDAHTHLGQAFGKSFVFGEPSQIWQRIWGPIEGSLTPDLARVSAMLMFVEALRGGFTTIANFAMADAERTAAVHDAANTVGIRLVSCTGASDLADYPVMAGSKPRLVGIAEAVRSRGAASGPMPRCAADHGIDLLQRHPRRHAGTDCDVFGAVRAKQRAVSVSLQRAFSGSSRHRAAARQAADRTAGRSWRTRPPRPAAPLHAGR